MQANKQAYWQNWGRTVKARLGDDFLHWKYDQITVIICCKNKSVELRKVLPALINQVERADLIILADDYSDDDSVEFFESFCAQNALASKVVRPPALGVFQLNTLRNLGFANALDGVVIIIDADLIVGPGFVQAHARLHRSAGRPVSSVGPLFEAADSSGGGPINFMWGHEGWAHVNHGPTGRVPTWATVLGGNLGLHRRTWEIAGAFDQAYDGFYGVDDQDLHYRLFLSGVQHVGDFEAHVIHLPHENAVSKSRHGDVNLKRFETKYGLKVYQAKNIPAPIDWLGWSRGPWNKIAARLASGEANAVVKRGAGWDTPTRAVPLPLPGIEHVDYLKRVFDADYVRAQSQSSTDDLFHLYLNDSAFFGIAPNALVDMDFVQRHLGGGETAMHPYLLYVAAGLHETLGQSPLFHPAAYAWLYKQTLGAPLESEAFSYFWLEGRHGDVPQHPLLPRASQAAGSFFDPTHYRRRAGVAGLTTPHAMVEHYLKTPDAERVSPNPRFDLPWFRQTYATAIDGGLDPLTWYLVKGARSGAVPHPLSPRSPQHLSSDQRERWGLDLVRLNRLASSTGPTPHGSLFPGSSAARQAAG